MESKGARQAIFRYVIGDQILIAQNISTLPSTDQYTCFWTLGNLEYFPYCDDFGPMNASTIISFIEQLDKEIANAEVLNPPKKIVYMVEQGRRSLTNAGNLNFDTEMYQIQF